MKITLLLTFVLFYSTSNAQEHHFGLSVGLSIGSSQRELYEHYESVLGFSGNALYVYKQNNFIAKISIGLQQKGFSQSLIFMDANGTILGEGSKESTRFSYAALEQLAGLEFGKKLYGSIMGGLSGSYYFQTNVSADQFELETGSLIPSYVYRFSNLEKLDFNAVLEAGIGVKYESGGNLFATVSYNRGLKNVRYENDPESVPWKNHYTSFRIGYRHQLHLKTGE
ncbi:MAG: hypothetical protein HRT57_03055 [Crocinitomicaceae bacterium]|nr:hypothetical protein [Crocinitomicaceae bacterium]